MFYVSIECSFPLSLNPCCYVLMFLCFQTKKRQIFVEDSYSSAFKELELLIETVDRDGKLKAPSKIFFCIHMSMSCFTIIILQELFFLFVLNDMIFDWMYLEISC